MKIRSQLEVSRRQLLQMGLVTTAATLVPTGVESLFPPESLAQGQDPLPSWNDGAAKQAILNFVRVTTNSSSGQFVPPAERVACFDQDGTTWVEQPIYSPGGLLPESRARLGQGKAGIGQRGALQDSDVGRPGGDS